MAAGCLVQGGRGRSLVSRLTPQQPVLEGCIVSPATPNPSAGHPISCHHARRQLGTDLRR